MEERIMPIASVNGTRLHYHVMGKGPPLVFIHPPMITSEVFRYQMVELANHFRVVLFDIRGHGHSERSEVPLTYSLIIEDMNRLLDCLHIEQAYLCGYSTGGCIALEAMMAFPDRFKGAILISAMSEVSSLYLKSALWLATQMANARFSRLLASAIAWGNADSRTVFTNLYRTALLGDIQNIKQYFDFSQTYNCTRRLLRIKKPTLLIYGKNDRSFQKYAHLLNTTLPHATLVQVNYKPHQLPTKACQEVNRLIREWVWEREEKE
jgi:pimeloyl-ACP methyl ester carboxylesterase